MRDQNKTHKNRLPGDSKLCLHDHTTRPVLRDVDRTQLLATAAQCAGRPLPTEIFLAVTVILWDKKCMVGVTTLLNNVPVK